ncbi:hypothetical protein QUT22_22505, partial [Xanthomonas citri pv. citri]
DFNRIDRTPLPPALEPPKSRRPTVGAPVEQGGKVVPIRETTFQDLNVEPAGHDNIGNIGDAKYPGRVAIPAGSTA